MFGRKPKTSDPDTYIGWVEANKAQIDSQVEAMVDSWDDMGYDLWIEDGTITRDGFAD